MNKRDENNLLKPVSRQKTLHRFSHFAMNAFFEIFIDHDDGDYSCQAANAAFARLGELENLLSRFIPSSEVSIVNGLAANKQYRLSIETYECIGLALEVYGRSDGAFDITLGPLVDLYKKCSEGLPLAPLRPTERVLPEQIVFDPESFSISKLNSDLSIDLGGIGKGFAVDKIAEVLSEWDIERALISAAGSTVFAMKPPRGQKGYTVTLSNPLNRKEILKTIAISNFAISSSGLAKGAHIFDPKTRKVPQHHIGTWLCTEKATFADALTTAFMVMTPEQIKKYHSKYQRDLIMTMSRSEGKNKCITTSGSWDSIELQS